MCYRVFTTEPFDKLYYKLDKAEQKWIQQVRQQLAYYPTGKILRFSWFREKRYGNKRLYYLIDQEQRKVFLAAFASKRDQQETIREIIAHRKELFFFLRRL